MAKSNVKNLTLFALTWPIFIEIMLHMLMGNADTLMLSQYSDNSVAAVGVANQLLSVIIVMFGFIAQGAAVLIAQNLGANNLKDAGEISVMSLSLNLWFSLLLSLFLFLRAEWLLKLMSLPTEIMGEAVSYMQVVGGLIFIQALIMTAGSILRSYGYTKDTMLVTIGMNIINVIGNFFVIFGPFGFPVLGVVGVAYSTAFSRLLGFIVILILLIKRSEGQFEFKYFFHYKKRHVKGLLKIGVPSAGEQLSYNASQMVITFFVAQIGTMALTTKVYVQNVMMVIMLSTMAIGQGTQILIGHMIGAGETDLAYKRGIKSLKLSIGISLAIASIVFVFGKPLLGIFTDDASIIENGAFLLMLTVILEPGRAFNVVMINSLRSAGDVKFPVYIGIIVMWGIGVTFAWFFAIYLGLGLTGIWISFIADEWIRGMFMLRRWRQRNWESMHFIEDRK